MTLTTHAIFLDPVSPEAVFGLARKLVGIPDEQPFKVDRSIFDDGRNIIMSESGGFKAMCWVYIDPSADTYSGCDCKEKYGDDDCGCHPRGFVDLMLDTTYGARFCGQCFHLQVIRGLREAFPCNELIWYDEFRGEWHVDVPDTCWDHYTRSELSAPWLVA